MMNSECAGSMVKAEKFGYGGKSWSWSMKVGDLVRNINSGELGVIIDFRIGDTFGKNPIVAWPNRTGFIMGDYVRVVSD